MEMNSLKLDENGHLLDYHCWNREIGEYLSKKDKLKLNSQHWQIINLVREIYLETEISPPMRLLIKAIQNKLSKDIANSRHLYKLFPDGPVRLACKYAGLPKPKHCL